jgi:hypothetical protein
MRRHSAITMLALTLVAACQTAVVTEPRRDDGTQTVVTVEQRPKTGDDDKDLTVIDKRD